MPKSIHDVHRFSEQIILNCIKKGFSFKEGIACMDYTKKLMEKVDAFPDCDAQACIDEVQSEIKQMYAEILNG